MNFSVQNQENATLYHQGSYTVYPAASEHKKFIIPFLNIFGVIRKHVFIYQNTHVMDRSTQYIILHALSDNNVQILK